MDINNILYNDVLNIILEQSENCYCTIVCKRWYNLIIKKSNTCEVCGKIIKMYTINLWCTVNEDSMCHTKPLFITYYVTTEYKTNYCMIIKNIFNILNTVSDNGLMCIFSQNVNDAIQIKVCDIDNNIMAKAMLNLKVYKHRNFVLDDAKLCFSINLHDIYKGMKSIDGINHVYFIFYNVITDYFEDKMSNYSIIKISNMYMDFNSEYYYKSTNILHNDFDDIDYSAFDINFPLDIFIFKGAFGENVKIQYVNNKVTFLCDDTVIYQTNVFNIKNNIKEVNGTYCLASLVKFYNIKNMAHMSCAYMNDNGMLAVNVSPISKLANVTLYFEHIRKN